MNTTSRSLRALFSACFAAVTLLAFCPQPACANTRQNAASELSLLRQTVKNRNKADEIKSTEATFAIAEHYFHDNDAEQSERFYLLTIQKARIIRASLENTVEEPAAPTQAADDAATPPPAVTVPDLPQPSVPEPAEEQPAVEPPPFEPRPEAVPEAAPAPAPTPETDPEAAPQSEDQTSDKLIGTSSTYTVAKGDTIRLIAAKLGVSRQHIVKRNKLDDKAFLKIGQKLVYNNLKIVPQRMKNGIVVNIPDRTLYYFKKGKLAVSLPVALGVPVKSEKYDWKTPTGKFRITAKMKDPTWHVPPSIQSEMEDRGKEVITSIPPGPENPLGKYAIKTSIPGILIHSTTKPWSIYSFASHGCIRVYPEHMEEFFKEVAVNTPGEIIYKPVKLALTEKGRVYLEVHRDVYGRNISGLATEARRLIKEQNLSGMVDWQKVESTVQHKSGIAEDITL